MRLHLVPLFAAALAAGCNIPSGPERDLDRARARWQHSGLASYSAVVRQGCFCPYEATQPVIVTVENGVVVDRRYEAGGEPVPSSYAGAIPSVDSLFTIIDDAIRRRAHRLEATYDPVLGFPTHVSIDYEKFAVDEEVVYQVRDVVAR